MYWQHATIYVAIIFLMLLGLHLSQAEFLWQCVVESLTDLGAVFGGIGIIATVEVWIDKSPFRWGPQYSTEPIFTWWLTIHDELVYQLLFWLKVGVISFLFAVLISHAVAWFIGGMSFYVIAWLIARRLTYSTVQ